METSWHVRLASSRGQSCSGAPQETLYADSVPVQTPPGPPIAWIPRRSSSSTATAGSARAVSGMSRGATGAERSVSRRSRARLLRASALGSGSGFRTATPTRSYSSTGIARSLGPMRHLRSHRGFRSHGGCAPRFAWCRGRCEMPCTAGSPATATGGSAGRRSAWCRHRSSARDSWIERDRDWATARALALGASRECSSQPRPASTARTTPFGAPLIRALHG